MWSWRQNEGRIQDADLTFHNLHISGNHPLYEDSATELDIMALQRRWPCIGLHLYDHLKQVITVTKEITGG